MSVCACVRVRAHTQKRERETVSEYGLVGGFKDIST